MSEYRFKTLVTRKARMGKTSFVQRARGKPAAWWCPTCQLLVEQADDPIECASCGGDMTSAPQSVLGRKR